MNTVTPANHSRLLPSTDGVPAEIFRPRAGNARGVQPISAQNLIEGLGVTHPGTRRDFAKIRATMSYLCGANVDVAVAYYAGGLGSGTADSAAGNVEKLKARWLSSGGTAAGFNNAMRSALAEVLAYPDYGDKDFARDYQMLTQTAAAAAKRAFPNDPAGGHNECMRLIRNDLWKRFDGFPLPRGIRDINDCRVTTEQQEFEGTKITGLMPKRNAKGNAKGNANNPHNPKS
jgi:hypothetical protein